MTPDLVRRRLALLACALPLSLNAAQAQPVGKPGSPDPKSYMTKQGWTPLVPARPFVSPVPGIAPLMYFSRNASAPSCALLVDTAAAPAMIELLAPEPGETYPQCLGIIDAAAFKANGRDYLVVEFITRETREDGYRRYYYLSKNAAGYYIGAPELNESVAGPAPVETKGAGDNAPRAREGVTRALAILAAPSKPTASAMQFDIKRVSDATSIAKLSAAVARVDKAGTLVKDQVMAIRDGASSFVVAPVISTNEHSGGCYLHLATPQFTLNKAVKIAANEDATSCDAVVAIFACKRRSGNAIGVIAGMRLGGQQYYTEGTVYTVARSTLTEDAALSKNIELNASAAAAKKKLGCGA